MAPSLLLHVWFFLESFFPLVFLARCLCCFLCHYLLVLLFVFSRKREILKPCRLEHIQTSPGCVCQIWRAFWDLTQRQPEYYIMQTVSVISQSRKHFHRPHFRKSVIPQTPNLLSKLSISQQLLHHGSLPVLLGDSGMIKVHWVVDHRTNLNQAGILMHNV